MQVTEALKNFIIEKNDIFTEKNVLIGSVDLSRYEASALCIIIPETTQITETDFTGFTTETKITVSMVFRNQKHSELVELMEQTAQKFLRDILNESTLNLNRTDITPGTIKYFYDCGTVEKQATGLDIELTITENKDL